MLREAGTKTASAATSLLSVPRIPSECQVSTMSTSLVRITSPTIAGPAGVMRGWPPSKTMPVIITQGASRMVLARGPRPVNRYPSGTGSAR
jgi:hypothetical protein